MKMPLSRYTFAVVGTVLLTAGATIPAIAKPAKAPRKATKSAKVICPKCKMTVSAKPTGHTRTPVKINGKTYYCCSACAG